MSAAASGGAARFRALHAAERPLVLPNAWDAASALSIEQCGAAAIATTSAGLAWSHGYPDGGALPPRVLAGAVAEIARVLSVPLSVDVEGGYADDPRAVADTVSAVIDAGGVGINLEDGTAPSDLLCAKIAAVKAAAARAGVDLFVNARVDVFLRRLAPPERVVDETLARAARYRGAGCDGIFVPGVVDPGEIRTIAAAVGLPLNVLVRRGLPDVATLGTLGVRRVSAGAGMARAALSACRQAAMQLLQEGVYDAVFASTLDSGRFNEALAAVSR